MHFQDLPGYAEKLILDKNNIGRLDQTLSQYERLAFLSIRENHVSTIAARTFMQLGQLLHLDLSKNRVSRITKGTFAGLKILQVRFNARYKLNKYGILYKITDKYLNGSKF